MRQEWGNFHVVSMVSPTWHQHMWISCISGAGLLLMSYKPTLEHAEGGILKIQLLSELQERKQNEWKDKSMHEISSILVSSMQLHPGVSKGLGAINQPSAEQVWKMFLPQRSHLAFKSR